MKTPEQKSLTDMLATTNGLLIVIAILLAIGLIFDLLICSSVINLPEHIYDGFNAIYKRMGQMRIY